MHHEARRTKRWKRLLNSDVITHNSLTSSSCNIKAYWCAVAEDSPGQGWGTSCSLKLGSLYVDKITLWPMTLDEFGAPTWGQHGAKYSPLASVVWFWSQVSRLVKRSVLRSRVFSKLVASSSCLQSAPKTVFYSRIDAIAKNSFL